MRRLDRVNSVLVGPLSKNDSPDIPLSFVDIYDGDIHVRIQVVQQLVRRRMYVQRGSNQEKKWRLCREFAPWKISEALELLSLLVPIHSRPVVKTLQRQMNVLILLSVQSRPAFPRG